MNGKRYLVGLAAGTLLLAGTVVSSYAAEPTLTPQPSTAYCQELGGTGGGRWGGAFSALEPVASLLGIQTSDVAAQRQAGKSLAEIAQAKGADESKLIDTILASRKATLDAQVKAGTLTQAQADLILERMQTQVKTAVERTTVGPMGQAGGMGPGMGQGARMGRGFGAGASR